jgi:putative DNA primase/helicase
MSKKKQVRKDTQNRRKARHKGSRDADKVNIALRYAQAGLPVIPLHGTKDGHCTCGDPDCNQPGRHPRSTYGVRDATSDAKLVRKIWKKSPKAKIGIGLGGVSKLLALVTEDQAARQKLREIVATKGGLPRTVTIWDDDRWILLFRGDGRFLRSRDLADGIRILGDGNFIIAPSSFDPAGKRHFATGLSPEAVEIAQAPDWLLGISAERVKENVSPSAPMRQVPPSVVIVRSSEIEPERVRWIWPGIIASGKVTGLVGHPGLGKSQVAIDIAATVSIGRRWPGDAANGNAGDVIILAAEDDAADTLVPRLIAAGADRTRIHVVKAVKADNGVERAFNLALDLDRLEREHDLRQVKLVVIDPVSAYLIATKGGPDRNNAGDVRTILGRLTTFAAQHDVGVLAISHLNKTSGARAITRIMGSLEWAAAPRAVFLVTEEAGTGRRLFLPLKNNLAPDRIGYAFEIVNKVVAAGIRTSAVLWSSDLVTISADEALAAAAKKVTSGAVDFLREVLSDGPLDQTEVVRLGKEAGYSEKSLRTAREKLGVTPKKEGFGANGKWVWVPAGGATVLKLVADNDASTRNLSDNKQPLESAGDSGDGMGQDHGREGDSMPGQDEPEGNPKGPDGDDVA